MASRIMMLPDTGEGLVDAQIVTWLVKPGDAVAINQPVVEIETVKALVELPCPFEGIVTQLLVAEGETVLVGAPIAVIEGEPEPAGADSPGTTPSTSAPAASTIPPVAAPPVVDAPGATPAESAPVPPVGSSAPGAPPADEPVRVLVGYGPEGDRPRRRHVAAPGASRIGGGLQHPVLAKPPVRQLARDLGIDLATVRPTGPGGIVTREDVTASRDQRAPAKLATYPGDDRPWLLGGTVSGDGRSTRVPIRAVRKRTAEAMVASAFTAPHVTAIHTVDVTKTMKLVTRLKADKEFADIHVTPLLIAAKALLIAAERHPEINASWDEANGEIVYKHYVNLGIAAATPRGLVVPNIKDAHRLSLHELGLALNGLTAAARANALVPGQLVDGTITITNLGVFSIDTGTPILNPGEAAILAFGAIARRPWVHHGKLKVRWVSQLALSFDHRLVDGGLGSTVLSDVARILADPAQAMVWG